MNATRPMHFVTIEDPIELFIRTSNLVSQREVHKHSHGFQKHFAVRYEDPDCIFAGEMDLETISMALSAAETGLLVFGTLHTNSAAGTMDRIINVFPSDQQNGIRGILASVIKCVISQQLLRRKKGGRVAALEILFTAGISSLIRQDKTHQLPGAIQQGVRYGMVGDGCKSSKTGQKMSLKWMPRLKNRWIIDLMREWLGTRSRSSRRDRRH